jgi:FkbH-like protein
LSQLTEKTNQFNVLKKPLDEEEIRNFIQSKDYKIFHGHLFDVFGDYGVVIFALVEIQNEIWHIHSLLMSCRVFGRNIEEAFLGEIIKRACEYDAQEITISFEESDKNAPAKEFVNKYFEKGFKVVNQNINHPEWIKIKKI